MKQEIDDIELALVIVSHGLGSKALKLAKSCGISGGTIFLGKGSVHNRFLELLGITHVKKEVVLMITNSVLAKKSLSLISEELNFKKNKTGIAFTFTLSYFYGSCDKEKPNKKGVDESMYNCIYVIVDKGRASDVVALANEAGSKGCTIINARGSSIHETSKVFSMEIEPEKEIVIILAENEITDNIVDKVREGMKIDEPGNGIIFIQNVNQTYGMKRPHIEKV